MKHQIIEITNQYPILPSYASTVKAETMDGLYWINVYPPMEAENDIPMVQSKQLCPWSMAAEFANLSVSQERKQQVLDSLRNGQRAMKQFGLPANRIMFMQDNTTRRITVWID